MSKLMKPTKEQFVFCRITFRLISPMLGTCTTGSIFEEHVLKKQQKLIRKANKQADKLTKELAKSYGQELTDSKISAELMGILRAYHELIGRKDTIPTDPEELAAYSKELYEEVEEKISKGQLQKSTVFMRSEEGKIQVSTHMILGNIKEILRITINNSTAEKENKILKSKVAVAETMALDVTPMEFFMIASNDLVRDAEGKPVLCERPISFKRMGETETAIALSEQLPVGTEMSCHLRIRKDSPIFEELPNIFDFGKALGLGQWRGSGKKGGYEFQLELLDHNPKPSTEGWS